LVSKVHPSRSARRGMSMDRCGSAPALPATLSARSHYFCAHEKSSAKEKTKRKHNRQQHVICASLTVSEAILGLTASIATTSPMEYTVTLSIVSYLHEETHRPSPRRSPSSRERAGRSAKVSQVSENSETSESAPAAKSYADWLIARLMHQSQG
jgi:hypothetical protein